MGEIYKPGTNYQVNAVKNLYRCYLQREADNNGLHSYSTQPYDSVRDSLTHSDEFYNLVNNKIFDSNIDKNINYTIIKIDNRAEEGIKNLQSKLTNNFLYHDNLEFVDYRKTDVNNFFQERNINISWVGTLFGLLPTYTSSELAITASHLVALEYLVNSDLDELIVFEDDVVLDNQFANILASCLQDLSKDYDFLSDQTLDCHIQETATVEKSNLVGSNYICRSYLQNSHLGFMLYSKAGAKKILDLYRKHGLIGPIDTFLFWLSRNNDLNGFSTFHSSRLLITKDIYGTTVTLPRTY